MVGNALVNIYKENFNSTMTDIEINVKYLVNYF